MKNFILSTLIAFQFYQFEANAQSDSVNSSWNRTTVSWDHAPQPDVVSNQSDTDRHLEMERFRDAQDFRLGKMGGQSYIQGLHRTNGIITPDQALNDPKFFDPGTEASKVLDQILEKNGFKRKMDAARKSGDIQNFLKEFNGELDAAKVKAVSELNARNSAANAAWIANESASDLKIEQEFAAKYDLNKFKDNTQLGFKPNPEDRLSFEKMLEQRALAIELNKYKGIKFDPMVDRFVTMTEGSFSDIEKLFNKMYSLQPGQKMMVTLGIGFQPKTQNSSKGVMGATSVADFLAKNPKLIAELEGKGVFFNVYDKATGSWSSSLSGYLQSDSWKQTKKALRAASRQLNSDAFKNKLVAISNLENALNIKDATPSEVKKAKSEIRRLQAELFAVYGKAYASEVVEGVVSDSRSKSPLRAALMGEINGEKVVKGLTSENAKSGSRVDTKAAAKAAAPQRKIAIDFVDEYYRKLFIYFFDHGRDGVFCSGPYFESRGKILTVLF